MISTKLRLKDHCESTSVDWKVRIGIYLPRSRSFSENRTEVWERGREGKKMGMLFFGPLKRPRTDAKNED